MSALHHARLAASALTLALVFGAPAAFAQQPAPDPQQPAPAPEMRTEQASMIQGELVSVDANDKTLVIETEDGKEEQLRYTDTTVVTGAERGIAGLANADGTMVTVRFSGTGAERVATEIAVHPKQ